MIWVRITWYLPDGTRNSGVYPEDQVAEMYQFLRRQGAWNVWSRFSHFVPD